MILASELFRSASPISVISEEEQEPSTTSFTRPLKLAIVEYALLAVTVTTFKGISSTSFL